MKREALFFLLCIMAASINADPPPPDNLHQRVKFDQLLGTQIPMATTFTRADGRTVTLTDVSNGKPMLLSMGYYQCPNLCDAMLTSIAAAVAKVNLEVGHDFSLVFIGIDPAESAVDVQQARRSLENRMSASDLDRWQFLLGDEASIRNIADAVGYRYFYEARIGQYIHPSGLVIADGKGVVSQYLFGVGYSPESLRLALVAASSGKVGNIIDHLVLLCSGYDPETGRYSLAVGKVLRIVAGFTVLLIVVFLFYLQRRSGRGGEGGA